MKNKKGFTLIELLAVIVILAIIALIAVPTIKKTIDASKKQAFMNTAYGLIKAGNLYYSRKDMMGEIFEKTIFTFPDEADRLETTGKLPKKGTMIGIKKYLPVIQNTINGHNGFSKDYMKMKIMRKHFLI